MDFDFAAKRLAKDHSKLKGSRLRGGAVGQGRNAPRDVSAKAKREAAIRKRQQERLASEKRARQQQLEWQKQLLRQCNRSLGVRSLNARQGHNSNNSPLALTDTSMNATSIFGEGDKIALPPSILEFLTAADFDAPGGGGRTNSSSPWTFRIGVLNPDYQFPASRLLKAMSVEATQDSSEGDNGRDDDAMDDDDEDDDDNDSTKRNEAYLDELAHQYLAYTHGTVVEFTQEEGHVGLPKPIATALLTQHAAQQHQQAKTVGSETIPTTEAKIRIPATRTVDPATSVKTTTVDAMETVENDTDTTTNYNYNEEEEEEKTPGHLAWGAFDVPALPIEVTLVQLPKGKACKLAPTVHAVRSGFYNLRNIKSVLEQSLVRSRATLSVGDTVHTWHRGVKYDLTVSTVTPATYNAVTCINTDIEVEFGPAPGMEQDNDNNNEMKVDNNSSADENKRNSNVDGKETGESKGRVLGGGRRLNSPSPLPVTAEGPGKTNDTTTTTSTTTAQHDSPGKLSMRELALAAAERRARENKG